LAVIGNELSFLRRAVYSTALFKRSFSSASLPTIRSNCSIRLKSSFLLLDPEIYLARADTKRFQYHQYAEFIGRAEAGNSNGFASEIRRLLNLLAGNKGIHVLLRNPATIAKLAPEWIALIGAIAATLADWRLPPTSACTGITGHEPHMASCSARLDSAEIKSA